MRKRLPCCLFLLIAGGCAPSHPPAPRESHAPATAPTTLPAATRPATDTVTRPHVGWSNYHYHFHSLYAVNADAAYDVAAALQSRPFDAHDPADIGSYVQLIAYREPVGTHDAPFAELELHRVSRDARKSRRLARHVVPFDQVGDYRPDASTGADPVAVDDTLIYPGTKGLTVIGPRGVNTYGNVPGAPESIDRLAAVGNRVFVAGPGALAEFDPVAGRFRPLAATGAAAPNSPLDSPGDRPLRIESLLPDPARDALWLSVSDGPPVARGIWRYDLAAGHFDHAMMLAYGTPLRGPLAWSPDGRLLAWGTRAYEYEIDPRTLLTRLIRPATPREKRLFQLPDPDDAVEIDGDMIGDGWLIGPDGVPRHFKRLGGSVFNIPALFHLRHVRLNPDGRGFVGLFSGPEVGYSLVEISRNTPDERP